MKKSILYFFIAILHITVYGQQEGFVINAGSLIHYRIFGKGFPLLIINGGPGMNSDGFTNLATKLSENNQTIIYDQRGTGRSALKKTDSSTITMKLMIEDIEALRKYLKINTWIILGHSFGGMLGSYYTSLYPEKVKALILSSSGGIDLELLSYVNRNINARLSAAESKSLNYWTTRINGGDTSYYARLQRGMALAPAYVYDRKNIPIIAERLTQGNSRINGLVWQDLQKISFDCSKQLASFKKPVLIIQGKQDIVEEKTAEKAHRTFVNSQIIFLDKSVHYGWLDKPVEYFAAIKNFLSGLKNN